MLKNWSPRALFTCLPLLLSLACSSSGSSGAANAVGGTGGSDDYGGGTGAHGGTGSVGGGGAAPGSASCGSDSCAATAISVGPDFACAVMRDGTVQCWGSAFEGGLGRGNAPSGGFEPAPVVELSGAVGIAVNPQASCALLKQGTVSCWGDGAISGFGTGTTVESETPADVKLVHATALTRGLTSMCASLEGGSAECWQDLLLFAPDAPLPALTPAPIPSVHDAKEIVVGSDHLCMLLAAGTVQCLGSNEHSQLGTGKNYNDLEQSAVMVDVKGLTGVTHLSAGDDFTCAVLEGGTVSCWGDTPGQAGDPNFDGQPTPTAVPGLSGVTAISATSADHACALVQGGAVECWGENSHGESGGPTEATVVMPVTVKGVSDATALSIGDDASCVVRKDGHVLCWGENFLDGPGGVGAAPTEIPF